MKNYKRFNIIIIISLVGYITFHFCIWNMCTKEILSPKEGYTSGDLSRIGYTKVVNILKKKEFNLSNEHIEIKDYKGGQVDIITIGDSYSNGAAGGLNALYQDHISSLYGQKVLNIPEIEYDRLADTLILLINSGYLDIMKPKAIIFQTVERYAVQRLAKTLDFSQSTSIKEFHAFYENKVSDNKNKSLFKFINDGNLKFLKYNIIYKLTNNSFISGTRIEKLTKPLLSIKDGKTILLYDQEYDFVPYSTDANIDMLNKNLNELSDLLQTKGIKLYFMPCVDKSNLYGPFLANKARANSTFFEKLRKVKRNYELIDTKAVLEKKLRKGEKDIYYADDTHWSFKGIEAVVSTIDFK